MSRSLCLHLHHVKDEVELQLLLKQSDLMVLNTAEAATLFSVQRSNRMTCLIWSSSKIQNNPNFNHQNH